MARQVAHGTIRNRRTFVLAIGIVALSILPLSMSGNATANPIGLGGRLLTPSDLPTGWKIGQGSWQSSDACVALPRVSQLVGVHGVGAIYQRNNGSPILAEYAVVSSSIFRTFESADAKLSSTSCSERSSSHVVNSNSFGEVMYVPTYGDWSIGVLRNVVVHGIKSQLGYVLVRKGAIFLVVAYENHGLLARRTLEDFTTKALSKITTR
jgi:hypothetical protein